MAEHPIFIRGLGSSQLNSGHGNIWEARIEGLAWLTSRSPSKARPTIFESVVESLGTAYESRSEANAPRVSFLQQTKWPTGLLPEQKVKCRRIHAHLEAERWPDPSHFASLPRSLSTTFWLVGTCIAFVFIAVHAVSGLNCKQILPQRIRLPLDINN